MLLHPVPVLAEVPDFSPEQLESLTRNVERKKQKLEEEIKQYIEDKQEELKDYEREVPSAAHLRLQMTCNSNWVS